MRRSGPITLVWGWLAWSAPTASAGPREAPPTEMFVSSGDNYWAD